MSFGVQAGVQEQRAVQALHHEASARARAERVTAFLRGAIGSANPYQPRSISPALLHSAADPWAEWVQCPWDFAGVDGSKATVADILHAAAARAPVELADEPLAMADVCETLGVTLFRHDHMELAKDMHSRCVAARLEGLGEENENTVRAMLRLAQVSETLQTDEALGWYRRALAACVKVYGPLDPRSLRAERMLANTTTVTGGDGGGLLLARIAAPQPQDAPIPPAQMLHVALASLLLYTQGDDRATGIAAEIARRIDAGEADSDVYCRVVASRNVLTVLQQAMPGDALVERLSSVMTRDAADTFGEWSPEYMNCVGSVEGATLAYGSSVQASLFYARACRAQLRLRGREHWETNNMLLATRMAMAGLLPNDPGVVDAATEVEAIMAEFPQGLSTPGVLATCLLAEGENGLSKHTDALARLEALSARVHAPQAVRLTPHALARLYTVRGTTLESLERREEAMDSYRAAAALRAQFQDGGDAIWWTRVARERLGEP